MNEMIRDNFRNNEWINPMMEPSAGAAAPRQSVQNRMYVQPFGDARQSMPDTPAQPLTSQPLSGLAPQSSGAFVEAPQTPSGLRPTTGMNELSGLTAINVFNQPTALNEEGLQYLNGFLLTQIGKRVTVELLIGSNTMQSRTGTLIGVGANYILLNEFPSNNVVSCDFYSIKFVTFYY